MSTKVAKAKGNKKYPWETWFKRRVVLEQGVDFKCTVYGMMRSARQAAARHKPKLSLSIRMRDKSLIMEARVV